MKNSLQIILFVSVVTLLIGCGGGGSDSSNPTSQPATGTSPTPFPLHVTGVTPSGPANIPLNQEITVTFDKAIDESTKSIGSLTNLDNIRLVGSDHHPIEVEFNGSSIKIIPVTNLRPDTAYTLTITSTLKAMDGGALVSNENRNFRTVPAQQSDTVLSLKWCYDVSPVIMPTEFYGHWGTTPLARTNSRRLNTTITSSTPADTCSNISNFNIYNTVIDFDFERPATYYVSVTACAGSSCSIPSNEATKHFD